MRQYPLMMNLEEELVLVVGGGKVALRKVKTLLECGAKIIVISPELVEDLRRLSGESKFRWIAQHFADDLMSDFPRPTLIFGTTDYREVNVRIYQAAEKRGIPCNIADVPDLCTFTVPAVVNRGDLMISVSTGGASPALSRRIRESLQRQFGEEYAILIQLLGSLRKQLLQLGGHSDENKKRFFKMVDSNLLQAIQDNDAEAAVSILRGLLPDEIDPKPIVSQAMTARAKR
ncbi:bifunctional precorrin-2 dehydrogenase/sirohydrochlorin ferrochelatase [Thermodesulfobacteriota bacterium]